MPYYQAEIAPALKLGKRVLVSAHGNSLRGIIKYLLDIGDEEIVGKLVDDRFAGRDFEPDDILVADV